MIAKKGTKPIKTVHPGVIPGVPPSPSLVSAGSVVGNVVVVGSCIGDVPVEGVVG
jgi:hypothetical protein